MSAAAITNGIQYLFIFILALLLAGCATYPVNAPTETLNFDGRVEFSNMRAQEELEDEILFLLTFSGGGTRAAALSYGVLEVLADTRINLNGSQERLLDEIDLISSVSGGSFTAAYFGLFGDRIFEDFEQDFLKRNIQGELIRQLFNPKNWFRLPSKTFGRSDLAAEHYDKHLFKDLTFGDLLDRTGPAIILNATDATAGAGFSFHQSQFDWLCSNIADYPVSRAVAASSAVPGALGSITVRNYAGTCEYKLPDWAQNALAHEPTHTPVYRQAQRISKYMDAEQRPFVHLLDGGLSDNLGVRALIDQITQAGGIVEGTRNIGAKNLRKIVVLIVNAETASEKELDLMDHLPLVGQLSAASGVPINRYNYETIGHLIDSLNLWQEELVKERCPSGQTSDGGGTENCEPLDTYFIEVGFDSLKDKSEQEYFKVLPTSFKLAEDEVDNLRDAAAKILQTSTEFQRLLQDLR
jgi:NTE family protein